MSGLVFFFKQKTAYEMRNSDWSSDVCSSDLRRDRQLDIGGRRPGDADAVAGRLLRPGQEGGEDADGRGLAVVPTGGDAVLRLLHLRAPEESRLGTEGASTCGTRWEPVP